MPRMRVWGVPGAVRDAVTWQRFSTVCNGRRLSGPGSGFQHERTQSGMLLPVPRCSYPYHVAMILHVPRCS
eukprot:3413693-Rhodomonas_salina.1